MSTLLFCAAKLYIFSYRCSFSDKKNGVRPKKDRLRLIKFVLLTPNGQLLLSLSVRRGQCIHLELQPHEVHPGRRARGIRRCPPLS